MNKEITLYQPQYSHTGEMDGALNLWAAVLGQAMKDARLLLKQAQRKPALWQEMPFRQEVNRLQRFFRERSMEVGGFGFLCDLLQIDIDKAAQRIEDEFLTHLKLPPLERQPKTEDDRREDMNATITLKQLQTMPLGDVANLDGAALADLQQQANAALERAKSAKEFLDGAIARKYGDLVKQLRQESGRDFGVVRLTDGDVQITADLPKRPQWDQKKLEGVVERIKSSGEDAREFVEISYRVSERKFNAWPSQIRQAFNDARTIKPGKPSFKLMLKGCEDVAA
ncbi:hypothetical protein [Magnetofaba australis]|uniref:Uncharacterized protein n=1 Tax=Magnetofaba australis IT-1 TaxID=1434232 RepID=A0A1Y2KBS4_9PROT|nr:hypothetical protein [Magnetofaba australis]OSM07378.1 hypothetical protein MAIT1_04711 [Magnetofaba australis IT-1]